MFIHITLNEYWTVFSQFICVYSLQRHFNPQWIKMLRSIVWTLFIFRVIMLVTTSNTPETEPPPIRNDSQESAPSFVNPKKMQRILVKPAGNTVSFKCRVNGNPTPNITWFKDGNTPSRTLGNLKYGQGHRYLTLEDLVTQDAGKYTCKACNKLGCINFTYALDVVGEFENSAQILQFFGLRRLFCVMACFGTFFCDR